MAAQWRFGQGGGRHEWTTADARDGVEPLDIARRTQRHELTWRLGPLQPTFSNERRQWSDAAGPTTRATGFRFEENGLTLAAAPGGGASWRAGFRRGLADSLRDGAWRRERDSRTAAVAVGTGSIAGMRLVGEGTWR